MIRDTDDRVESAQAYAARGWKCYPIQPPNGNGCSCRKGDACEDAGKHPYFDLGGLGSATKDKRKLKTIFGSSDANIGLLCDRFWVLDIDGEEGIRDLDRLTKVNGDLPRTPIAVTGGGGRHYLFATDKRVKSRTKIGGCSIDTKAGKSSAIVAAPSIHANGNRYLWAISPDDCEIATAPSWLIDFVTGRQKKSDTLFEMGDDNDLRTAPGVGDGERNAQLCRLVGTHLAKEGDSPDLLQLATDWGNRCDPPMKAATVAKTVANLVAKHLANNPDNEDDEEEAFELDLEVVSFNEIESKPIAWLWPGRFALGKITLLTGEGGVGKSMLTCDMAARISKGVAFPDGASCPIGDAFFIGAEDGAEDTVKPRLEAAGAIVDRVHLIKGPKPRGEAYASQIDLSRHMGKLDQLLDRYPEAKLIVIDPIMDYLGEATNSDKATDVRRVLSPLRSLAERHSVAIVAMNHLNKSGRGSKNRSLGSGAFVQVARIELRVCEDPEDSERRLLLPVKNNLAAAPGLAYRIESAANGAGFAVWQEGEVEISIGEVESADQDDDRSALAEAIDWLQAFLSDGAVKAAEAKKQARADGIADRTLNRAKKRISVQTFQKDRCHWWQLPGGDTNNPRRDRRRERFKLRLLIVRLPDCQALYMCNRLATWQPEAVLNDTARQSPTDDTSMLYAWQPDMDTQQLFESLNARSLRVKLRSDRQLEVIGDLSLLTDAMKTALRDNRQLFLNLLEHPEDAGGVDSESVRLGSEDFSFSIWEPGEQLRSPIAIDTETELIKDFAIPRIALASVSDKLKHRLIRPADLQAFIDQHSGDHFVAHNAAFDFAVIRQALRDPLAWVEVADQGRLHDTMILDALIRLARDDSYPSNRDLGTLAKVYLGVVIDKDDPFRLRYAELIDRPWDQADPGFFRYAIKDAIATRKVWDVLQAIALNQLEAFPKEFFPPMIDRFGLLTESLQVRGAIALGQIERNGIALDQLQVESTKAKLGSEVESLIEQLQQLPETDGLFKRTKAGSLILTASGKPSTNNARLIDLLEEIAEDLEVEAPRTGKTNKISSSVKFWSQFASRSIFLSLWIQLEEVAKLCQFFAGLKTDRIHPRYSALVRTGRTSCHGPNIQQLPRAGGFREMIVPSTGYVFLGIDYSAIELRTLAAVLESRYGSSKLANVIREGIDPHSFTASMFAGVSLEQFEQLTEKKQLRQQAKAINFGIPGGLGAKSLVSYAATTYGVELSIEQATSFRDRLISEVYPELSQYLEDDPIETLARNLKTSAFRVRSCFETDGSIGAAKRIVTGKGKASGAEYGEGFVDRVWDSLKSLNQNRKLRDRIVGREAGERLSQDLFFSPVATMTGRVRGKVGFSQSKNTPFQGLAADGAKLALWGLYRAGFRAVAFVHDEVLIELPIDADHTAEAKRVDSILCRSMEQLTGTVPIACEYSLSGSMVQTS